jgi:hypothetical protein
VQYDDDVGLARDELGELMSDLKPILLRDFSGGENTVTSPYLLKENQAQQVLNLILDEHGSLRARDGTLAQGVAAPRPDRPIVKIYDLNLVGGTTRPLAIQLGTFGPNSLWIRNTAPWTLIADFTSVYQTPDMVTFTNLGIVAPGNTEVLKSTDGTAATGLVPLTGAPNAAHLAVHLGFLWAGNTNATTTATSGPSSVSMSDLNNPNSWPGAAQTFIAKDDGQSIQALTQYTIAESGISPTSTLICWKDFSGYEMTGVLGTTTFSVQKIKSDMGCVAPRSCQFISGFGIVRLTHRGFALYDGVNDTLISEEERPRIFGRDQFTGIDWTHVHQSMATQCANPPLYICACPLEGSNGALQRVFVFDLVRRSWTVCTYANDLATCQLILDPGKLPQTLFGDFRSGFVRRTFASDPTDDGVAINWALTTRAVSTMGGFDRAYWRRMLAKFFGVAVGTTVTVTFFYGPQGPNQSSTIMKTFPTFATLSTFLGWGLDPWGITGYGSELSSVVQTDPWGTEAWGGSVWSGTAIVILTDVDLEFPMGYIANSVTAVIASSGPGKFRGCEFHARQKALTRSTRVTA